jgi:hypothetical protein
VILPQKNEKELLGEKLAAEKKLKDMPHEYYKGTISR